MRHLIHRGWLLRVLIAYAATFVFLNNATGQNRIKYRIDSMNKVLEAQSGQPAARTMLKMAELFVSYDPAKGVAICERAMATAQMADWNEGYILALLYKGLNELSATQYDSARFYYNEGLNKAVEAGEKTLQLTAYKHLGNLEMALNNNPAALENFFAALKLAGELRNTKSAAEVMGLVGEIYETQRSFAKALEYYKRAYDSSIAAGDRKSIAKNLLNIGQIYRLTDRDELSIGQFEKAKAIFSEINDASGVNVATAYLGAAYAESRQYEKGLAMDNEALAFYNTYSDLMNIATVKATIANTYLRILKDTAAGNLADSLKDRKRLLDKAFVHLFSALEISRQISNTEGVATANEYLSMAWELKGDSRKALEAYHTFVTLRDSLYSADNNSKISNLEVNMAVDVKNKELEIKKLQLEKKNNQYVFFLACSLLLLVVTFILFRNNRTQRHLNETISKLVDEQERIIAQRTEDLVVTNNKLRALIDFTVHNLREPLTRIMGLLMLRKDVGNEEFLEICVPMMEESVNELDDTLKEVVKSTEKTQTKEV